jgi:hypothetical protein
VFQYRHVVALGRHASESKREHSVNTQFLVKLNKHGMSTFQLLTEAYDGYCRSGPRVLNGTNYFRKAGKV